MTAIKRSLLDRVFREGLSEQGPECSKDRTPRFERKGSGRRIGKDPEVGNKLVRLKNRKAK